MDRVDFGIQLSPLSQWKVHGFSLGDIYANYADENRLLTYAQLHKNALDARLLQEVQSRMNDVTLAEQRLITETVEQTYSNIYNRDITLLRHELLERLKSQIEKV